MSLRFLRNGGFDGDLDCNSGLGEISVELLLLFNNDCVVIVSCELILHVIVGLILPLAVSGGVEGIGVTTGDCFGVTFLPFGLDCGGNGGFFPLVGRVGDIVLC